MADSALGSALIIPESALKKIKEADDKLQKLQDTAKNTASSVTQSFKDMSVGTKPFLNSLDQVIAKLATINASASNASSGISNVGASAGNMNNNITSAAQNIQNMVAQLSKMNGSGTSGIMQAALAFQRLQESAKGASGMNIAELKQEIGSIESMLRDTTQNLTKADQDALIKRKKSLQDELRYQQQMYNERAVAFQKALDKMVSAEQSYNNKQRKAYADRAKDYQTRNNKANTTYQGALDFSATANTLNRQVRAIEYLKEARMKLSQTDADYKRKLDILNAAIEQHNKNLKEAGVNSRALTEQTSYMAGYMSRWAQRMAFTFSFGAAKSFVGQIAEVRGQFELSERSLEAILQNKPKADEIFNKTVELAVKSPFRIKDLVDYTRQLSAYRIESDKLYDTTKRLADVSAGLGVDMGRLILAYGQVKAAAYLRGSEVRQFTEAGINMYGELQQYFKEVKGEAYTTAQIVDMISKRKVTFEDVEAIFQRMTDKGGTFYNMQEIQAETLQGKISNLKDAFDVMLNDIGKANEGTMKGMVSWGTSMLDNWKALAEIGKALIPILIAIKANSMFAKTNLGQAFSQASGTGIVRYKALFVNSLDGMKKALKDFGGLVKSSLSGIGVGLAIYAVAEVITTVYDKISKYNENVRKAEEETIKAKGAIGALAGTYNDLANAATNANGKLEGKDLEKNVEDRRTTLQKLIDAASKDGLTFKINVDSLDANQLNATFSKVEKEYKDFIDSIEVIRRNYAKNDAKNTWFTDGLDDDADDYKDAVIDALAKSSQMERVVANINANYKQATSTTKKYFDEIRAGQKDNESNIDYMTRMYELIKKINIAQGGSDYKMPSFIGTSQADFNDLIRAMNSVQNKAQELNSEFDAVFGDLRKKYSNNPIKIQGVIDRIAAERDWSQYERDLAYRHFGINVYIDRANMEKQVSWVDDYINDFFAKKKYGISLVVKEIDDDKAFEGFLGKGDQAAKAAKS